MEIKAGGEEAQAHRQPLLQGDTRRNETTEDKHPHQDPKNPKKHKAIRRTLKKTAHLANLLPTGTLMVFQFLSPVFTKHGQCNTFNLSITAVLIFLCGISCFLLCFTDSYKDERGKIRHGVATFKGLWPIDGGDDSKLPPAVAATYKLRFIDLVHALTAMLVFVALALFDRNVVDCFYPTLSKEKELLIWMPVVIGVICSIFVAIYPTKRHGIGFPLSSDK